METPVIDLNKLQVFVAVAQQGSIRGAAEKLHVTPSAISQSVSSLEGQLGLKLLDRVGRRIALTEQGLRVFRASERHQRDLYQSVSEALGQESAIRGEIKVGAYLEFTKSRLMDVLEQFLREYPEASLRFRFEAPSKLERLLRENTIDIAFSINPTKEQPTFLSTPLYREELLLVGRPQRIEGKISISDFLEQPIIEYYHSHRLFQRWLKHHFGSSGSFKVRTYAATAEMVLELVLRNLGIGVVPKFVAEPYLRKGELMAFTPSAGEMHDFLWMNELTSPYRSKAFQIFRQKVLQAFSNQVP